MRIEMGKNFEKWHWTAVYGVAKKKKLGNELR
jgi:hypothetical protein